MIEKTDYMFERDITDKKIFGSSVINDEVINELTYLYEMTDWRCVIIDEQIHRWYGSFSTISIFKALALPYLIKLKSERKLSIAISNELSIQLLCGFNNQSLPKKRTFWHFRNKYKHVYSEVMLKVLISMVLNGKKPRFDLPFVELKNTTTEESDSNTIELLLDYYHTKVLVSINEIDLPPSIMEEEITELQGYWMDKLHSSRDFIEYKTNYDKYRSELFSIRRRKATGFLYELRMPVDVSVTRPSGELLKFSIVSPPWFDESRIETIKIQSVQKDYDKACNILVIKTEMGKRKILLSQRKDQGYGLGKYALPGGKQNPGESLEECARRELREETNLSLIKSRPVSIYVKKEPKEVVSVGVLAEEWEGKLDTKEPDHHAGWKWHDIDNLPKSIFEPTRRVIQQFVDGTFPNLDWEEFEEKKLTQLTLFEK